MIFFWILFNFIAFTSFLYPEKINFTARSLTLEFPSTIVASGNTYFKTEGIEINSHNFSYDIKMKKGNFNKNVVIKNNNSILKGDTFSIDYLKNKVSGHGNISLKSNTIQATSNDLEIKDYEILRLYNNVQVEQNGSQIKSNELIYNLKTDSIISNKRIKLIIKE